MGLSILAVDTSTEACSVAVLHQGKVSSEFMLSVRSHAQFILPMIDRVLSQAACHLAQLDAIAFAQGPGSFTGIRIGLGVAQGLALAVDKPLISISTLQILAQGTRRMVGATHVNTAIDARMNQVYFAQYAYNTANGWNSIISEQVAFPAKLTTQLGGTTAGITFNSGTGFQTYPNLAPESKWSGVLLPDARDMLPLAESAWYNDQVLKVEEAQPVYLRNQIVGKKAS